MVRKILRIPLIIAGHIAVLFVSVALFLWYWIAKGTGALIRLIKRISGRV